AFRRLWIGQAVSQFGDAFYGLLFLFMVDRLTGSPALVGVVGALEALPFLCFSPLAGVLADRLGRRELMLCTGPCRAGVLLALGGFLLVHTRPPLVLLLVTPFLLSLINVFFAPAKSAAIPSLVPTDRLMEANALSTATQSLMPLLGLGLSGSVLGLL